MPSATVCSIHSLHHISGVLLANSKASVHLARVSFPRPILEQWVRMLWDMCAQPPVTQWEVVIEWPLQSQSISGWKEGSGPKLSTLPPMSFPVVPYRWKNLAHFCVSMLPSAHTCSRHDSLFGLFNQYLFSTHKALNIEQHFLDKRD